MLLKGSDEHGALATRLSLRLVQSKNRPTTFTSFLWFTCHGKILDHQARGSVRRAISKRERRPFAVSTEGWTREVCNDYVVGEADGPPYYVGREDSNDMKLFPVSGYAAKNMS